MKTMIILFVLAWHDIPKHLHMMEQAVSDIIDDEYSVDTMLNAIACVTEEKVSGIQYSNKHQSCDKRKEKFLIN